MFFLIFDKNNIVYWFYKKIDCDQIDNDVWVIVNVNIMDFCIVLLIFIFIENKDKYDSLCIFVGFDFFLIRFNIEFMLN